MILPLEKTVLKSSDSQLSRNIFLTPCKSLQYVILSSLVSVTLKPELNKALEEEVNRKDRKKNFIVNPIFPLDTKNPPITLYFVRVIIIILIMKSNKPKIELLNQEVRK